MLNPGLLTDSENANRKEMQCSLWRPSTPLAGSALHCTCRCPSSRHPNFSIRFFGAFPCIPRLSSPTTRSDLTYTRTIKVGKSCAGTIRNVCGSFPQPLDGRLLHLLRQRHPCLCHQVVALLRQVSGYKWCLHRAKHCVITLGVG